MSPGGTLLEVAARQDRVGELRDWALKVGMTHIEVSNGLRVMPAGQKQALVRELAEDFVVLAETGAKTGNYPPTPAQWAAEMAADLDAGASWVIAEGRESGTVGLYHADQGIREDLVSVILDRIPRDKVIFEAPGKSQQAWFIQHLGPDVNIGNVAPAGVLSLETLRLGLRADTAPAGPGHVGRPRGLRAAGMIPDPVPNTITRPYRGLSVQEVDVPLTPPAIEALLRSREIYRRTAYLVLRRDGETALVAVRPADPRPLFSPVAELRVLSGPDTTAWITDPAADVGNATALAQVAGQHQRDGVLGYVIQGKFEHVNFIWRPAPVQVRVTEVVPPHPPKLLAMAEQVVSYDEDLPPVQLVLDAVNVQDLMASNRAAHYLLPCRGSGIPPAGRAVSFLDTHPPYQPDWLLIGCERSRQFHEHFYRTEPRRADLCPRSRADGPADGLLLTKCCLLERGIEVDGATAVVPWGANLDEVRAALRALCDLPPVSQPLTTEVSAGPQRAEHG